MSVTVSRLVSRGIALHLVVVLAMALSSQSYGAAPASKIVLPDTVASIPLNWRNLELHDSRMTGSVTTRIDLRKPSASDLQSTLIDAPIQISQRVAGTRIHEITVAHSIRLLLGAGIETQNRLWFNENDGLPLQLIRIRQGSGPSQKLYRFGSNQVYRLRRKPRNRAETKQPPEHWSKISESLYPLPSPNETCPAILESSQLLYLLSNPDFMLSERPGELCVFDRKRVYKVSFRVLRREQVDVDYLQIAAGQESSIRHTQEAFHIILTSRPLEIARGEMEPFSFLGLKDEIHLLISDPERIPLRVRGLVPGFGMIDLELKKLIR